MPRGKTPGVYLSNAGQSFKHLVDRDRFAEGDFGWTAPVGALAAVPRGVKLRHVSGYNATTNRRSTAIVPDPASDIWTGAATTYNIETDAATTEIHTVVNYFEEQPAIPLVAAP